MLEWWGKSLDCIGVFEEQNLFQDYLFAYLSTSRRGMAYSSIRVLVAVNFSLEVLEDFGWIILL